MIIQTRSRLAQLSRCRRPLLPSQLFGLIGELRPRSRQHQLDGAALLSPARHCQTAPDALLGEPPV